MKEAKYTGSIPELQGMKALVRDDEKRGRVLVQFNAQRVDHVPVKPGEGVDAHLPYCFGWHSFSESDFEFERIEGHGVDCRCLDCWPEPHSQDQLRRRF